MVTVTLRVTVTSPPRSGSLPYPDVQDRQQVCPGTGGSPGRTPTEGIGSP